MKLKDKLINASLIFSLIFSFIALLVSIRTCQQNDQSISIQKVSFQSERNLILKADLKDKNILRLNPTENDIVLQRIKIYYPRKLQITEWTLNSQNFDIYLEGPKRRIQVLIDSLIQRKKYTLIINDNDWIPIALVTNYVAKGTAFKDISVYYIDYTYGIIDDPNNKPTVTFRGLVYSKRIDSFAGIPSVLNQEWENCLTKFRNEKKQRDKNLN